MEGMAQIARNAANVVRDIDQANQAQVGGIEQVRSFTDEVGETTLVVSARSREADAIAARLGTQADRLSELVSSLRSDESATVGTNA